MGVPVLLLNAGCEARCERCTLECAILPERLAWWQSELERLHRQRSFSKHKDRNADQLCTAQGAVEALERRIEASPRSLRRSGLHPVHLPPAASAHLQ